MKRCHGTHVALSLGVAGGNRWQKRRRWHALLGRALFGRSWWREAITVSLLTIALVVIGADLFGQGYRVEGQCMEPWLHTGERVLGDKWTFRFRKPRRGDIIIFLYPRDPSRLYIKRVIALSGETVEMRGGQVYVNGSALSEPYLEGRKHGDWGPHRVDSHGFFVLGDNRDRSDDSRYWGDVDRDAVVARAALRYWPPGRGIAFP